MSSLPIMDGLGEALKYLCLIATAGAIAIGAWIIFGAYHLIRWVF